MAHAQDAAKTAVQQLVNTVSQQGSVKLTAEQEQQMTDWLKVNSESVRNVHPSTFKPEVLVEMTGRFRNADNAAPAPATTTANGYTWHDVRFAESDTALYVFLMDVPQGDMRIKALHTAINGRIIGTVKLLGSTERMSWEQEERELLLEKPHVLPKDGVVVFKITWTTYYKEKPRDPSIKILEP
ncbi:hypothetical protein C8P68_103309 [Mucilaginibacter yixingensis]|uniref:Uncharacterized protein n=1 Tax=Mucilaginibacter yixingensis TaxID=1295612 RepID=A0A2T5JBJ7_9SPHI|nr:hypothetical protein [Mucilaginibacter yixingensis]PTQ98149.1 hypothetical protein C8P68_103309 [Mucilaginibacter yixingensis]